MCNEGEHGLWLADWFQFSHGNILQVRIASRVVWVLQLEAFVS